MTFTIDSRMINFSGIGTYLRNLLQHLVNHKDYFLNLIGYPEELNQFKNVNIISAHSSIYSIREQFELPLKSVKADIFWAPHYNVPFLPVKSKKRVVTIHDVYHLAFAESLNVKQRLYSRFMIKRAVSLSDRIVTDSEFSKSEIIKYTGIDDKKLEVISCGVDVDRYRIFEDKELFLQVKKRYALPEQFILFVGNVKPHKNLKMLLRAFQNYYHHEGKKHFLVIVGKKEGFITGDNEIHKILKSDGDVEEKVVFTGYVRDEDLPVIYNIASVFVFPSLYEGFGLPPLEAMACGCPVIVSNAASLPEACGDAACYINPNDAREIAQRIGELLSDNCLRQELIEKGLQRVKLFSWEKAAFKHVSLFEEVIKN